MIVYIYIYIYIYIYKENPKEAIKKLLGLINEFGKFEGYKINS